MATSTRADWLIVAAVATAFIVIPAVIAWRPPALSFRVSFIILPLIPAIGLAAIAVWFAIRRHDGPPNPNP